MNEQKILLWTDDDLKQEIKENSPVYINYCCKIIYGYGDEYIAESIVYDVYDYIFRRIGSAEGFPKCGYKSLKALLYKSIRLRSITYISKAKAKSKNVASYTSVDKHGKKNNDMDLFIDKSKQVGEEEIFAKELSLLRTLDDAKSFCKYFSCCADSEAKLCSNTIITYDKNNMPKKEIEVFDEDGRKIENTFEIGIKILINDKFTRAYFHNKRMGKNVDDVRSTSYSVDCLSYKEIMAEYNIKKTTFDHIKKHYQMKLQKCVKLFLEMY